MGVYIETADTIDLCHKKIYDKYGRQNVSILSNKAIKIPQFLGLWKKDAVEVTFIVKEHDFSESDKRSEELSRQAISKIDELNAKEQSSKRKVASETNLSPYLHEAAFSQGQSGKIEAEKAEILQMLEASVSTLAKRVAQMSSGEITTESPNIRKLRSILEQNAFSPEYIRKIISYIRKNISLEAEEDLGLIQRLALDRIAESIKISSLKTPDISSTEALGMTFSLIGPTGVGKTTSVAKLCAYFFLAMAKSCNRKFNVSAITIDNYRIGGWEQIQKYCYHMQIPLTVATNADELQKAVRDNKKRFDVTFIDTSGRSPNDNEKIAEMRDYFSGLENDVQFFLALNASTQPADVENIIHSYSIFDYNSLIITKTDEASYFGGLISALDKSPKPIAYIATGQDVPKDIERASKNFFLKKLIGFENFADYIDEHFSGSVESQITWE